MLPAIHHKVLFNQPIISLLLVLPILACEPACVFVNSHLGAFMKQLHSPALIGDVEVDTPSSALRPFTHYSTSDAQPLGDYLHKLLLIG